MDLLDEIENKQQEKGNLLLLVFMWFGLAAVLVGLGALLYDIHTIVLSGPVVGILGLIVFVFALIKKQWMSLVYSIILGALPVVVLFLIIVFEIPPSQAKEIVPFVVIFFLIALIPMLIKQTVGQRKRKF